MTVLGAQDSVLGARELAPPSVKMAQSSERDATGLATPLSERIMTERIKSYRDLRVWKEGMDLIVAAYAVAKRLPKEEMYGLGSQIRRAAVSISANVAEGHGRDHLGDYLRHLSFAKGSVTELKTELLAAQRLGYVAEKDIEKPLQIADGVGRMLTGLTTTLGSRFSRRAHRAPSTAHRAPPWTH